MEPEDDVFTWSVAWAEIFLCSFSRAESVEVSRTEEEEVQIDRVSSGSRPFS